MCIAATKALTRHLVDFVKCAKRAAAICGVSPMTISRWGNDGHRESIPFHHLKQLDAACDDIVLKEWAHERGYKPLERDGVPNQEKIDSAIHAAALVTHRAAGLNFEVVSLLSDGHKSMTDERIIRDRIAPLKDTIAVLERAIA